MSGAQGVEHSRHTGSREGLGRRGASRGERTGQALEGREEGQNRGPGAGDLRELPRVPLRGEGSCGGGGVLRGSQAPRRAVCGTRGSLRQNLLMSKLARVPRVSCPAH